MHDHRIFHLRFDFSQPQPQQTAFSCEDFRKCLYVNAAPYQKLGKMMMTDAAHVQTAFDFLNSCTAFAQTEAVDTDIIELNNGYEAIFYFDAPMLEGTVLSALADLMRKSDRCVLEAKDIANTPMDEPVCIIRLSVVTHKECVLA